MQKATRLTAAQRNRALGRLRNFTVGTALASAAATGAFGYLAVNTNPGAQVTSDKSATTTTADARSNSSSNTENSSEATTTSPTATPGLRSSTSGVTTTTRRAHATTGGS